MPGRYKTRYIDWNKCNKYFISTTLLTITYFIIYAIKITYSDWDPVYNFIIETARWVMNKNVKTAVIIGVTAIALLILLPIIFGSQVGWSMGCWSPWGSSMMGGLGLWWLIPLFWVTFLALVAWAVISLVRSQSSSRNATISMSSEGIAPEIPENKDTSSKKELEAKKKACRNKKYPDYWIQK
jgi:uncharacterized membrane protein